MKKLIHLGYRGDSVVLLAVQLYSHLTYRVRYTFELYYFHINKYMLSSTVVLLLLTCSLINNVHESSPFINSTPMLQIFKCLLYSHSRLNVKYLPINGSLLVILFV